MGVGYTRSPAFVWPSNVATARSRKTRRWSTTVAVIAGPGPESGRPRRASGAAPPPRGRRERGDKRRGRRRPARRRQSPTERRGPRLASLARGARRRGARGRGTRPMGPDSRAFVSGGGGGGAGGGGQRPRGVDAAHGIAAGVLALRVDDDRLPERPQARVELPVVMVPESERAEHVRRQWESA